MKNKLIFVLILILAINLRLLNINWDNNNHLHPDERFLTMVMNDCQVPQNLKQYLNPQESPLNPYNNNYDFFVYGNAPLIFNKLLAVVLNKNTYNELALQGRVLSATIDIIAVILVFLLTKLWEKEFNWSKKVKYFASFFYATAVLPIQLSHFFATDTFLNTFLLASCFFLFKFRQKKNLIQLFYSALFFALALASKITALVLLPLILFVLLITVIQNKKVLKLFLLVPFYLMTSYLFLRLFNPYIFANNSWLNFAIEPKFIANLKMLKSWEGNDVWFPPAIQWINTRAITFALKNLFIYGIGLTVGLLAEFSIFIIIKHRVAHLFSKKTNKLQAILILGTVGWLISFFIYQSTKFVKAMRYFLMIYPYLAIFAGFAISKIKKKFILLTCLISSLIWPLMFISIYLKPHSRVTASEWIYQHLPENAVIATELWDDPLPLHISNQNKKFEVIQLGVFNQDTPAKWSEINQQLATADYYILSSNRAWGSIGKTPDKYPITSKFYQYLFEEKLQFTKLIEFNSYPSLTHLGIPLKINDDGAEEAFSVYDHPKVIIFSKK